ncbi:MAG: DUF4157 domain-containing protein [Chitinophagaceae bacterium]|nr:DUF4157 domain-containing protein [Chitinophagaceae bacterium]
MDYKIKENSKIAAIAALLMKASQMAMVVGKTIYLHNTSREEFLGDTRWLRHEMVHLRQFEKYGLLRFLLLYTWESIRKGYYNNKYEIEARKGETL